MELAGSVPQYLYSHQPAVDENKKFDPQKLDKLLKDSICADSWLKVSTWRLNFLTRRLIFGV